MSSEIISNFILNFDNMKALPTTVHDEIPIEFEWMLELIMLEKSAIRNECEASW